MKGAPWGPVAGDQLISSERPHKQVAPPPWLAPPTAPPPISGFSPPAYPFQPIPGGGWTPPFPGRGPRRRRIAVIGAVLAVIAATVTTAITLAIRSHQSQSANPAASSVAASSSSTRSSTGVTTAPGSPAPPVPGLSLATFLLPAQQVADIFGVASMMVQASSNGLTDDGPVVSEKDCTGPYAPADLGAFGSSGYLSLRVQLLKDPNGPSGAEEVVIAFPSASAAEQVLAQQRQQWAACSGRTFTLTMPNEPPHQFTFGPLSSPDDAVAMTLTPPDRSSAGIQRALAARRNIIIDVAAIGFNVGNRGLDILNAIAAKIPQ